MPGLERGWERITRDPNEGALAVLKDTPPGILEERAPEGRQQGTG